MQPSVSDSSRDRKPVQGTLRVGRDRSILGDMPNETDGRAENQIKAGQQRKG